MFSLRVTLLALGTLMTRTWALYEYYDAGAGYVSDYSDWGTLGGRAHQPKCVDIPETMRLCHDIGYKTMRLPNLLGHESVQEAVDQARVWVMLLNLHCHPDTKLFLCSLYSPVCLEPSVYPCRSLCEGVQNGCEGRMNNYNYPWPEILRCDQFPEELCIEQVNFESGSGANTTTANVCHACKQPMTFESLLDSYCWATFVVKIKMKKVEINDLGDKILEPKGKVKFYKPIPNNMTKAEMKALRFSITDGARCDCETLENKKSRKLIMGAKQGSRFVITYVSEWTKNKEFKRAIKAIRKGHDCKQQIEKEIGGQNENNGGLSISGKPHSQSGEVDVSIDGGFEVPDTGGKDQNRNKRKNKKDKGNKGKKKKKDKKGKKDKKDKDKEDDPMANIAGIGCIPCKQPLVFENLIEKFCAANFVTKIQVRKVKMDSNGDKRLQPKRLKTSDFYKQKDLSKRDIKRLQPVISGGSGCDCIQAKRKNTLFVMGTKQGGRDVITFLSEFVKDSEFTRFTTEIENGYDCSSVVQTE
ncbi:secreted frizzled-related protein 1-like isoform X6 [Mya arenaria]|uniref:secreted frizzled-related protein 1-like isoform X6 n=1 Tax=Mya arenaria TaxID=6604 RepID=UPI0022E18830|nr:secreted frizzled-related protein 1-like isoform X6 [Mya arenaria]XP_052798778.1 secreted frizzled-related protein 1-like isoform X6 [Mya arenaria]